MSRINGKYLKEKRTERGCSLRAFADKIYTSKSTASRWEQSSLPENQETLSAIAQFFDMTVDEMRKESEQKYPDMRSPFFIQEKVSITKTESYEENSLKETKKDNVDEKEKISSKAIWIAAGIVLTFALIFLVFLFF